MSSADVSLDFDETIAVLELHVGHRVTVNLREPGNRYGVAYATYAGFLTSVKTWTSFHASISSSKVAVDWRLLAVQRACRAR